MFRRLLGKRIREYVGLFNGYFVDVKAFYALEFDAVPCVGFVGEIDAAKAFALITEQLVGEIVTTYQHAYFDHKEQKMLFNNTLFVLRDRRMIEVGGNYCQLLHATHQYQWANQLVKDLAAFRLVVEAPTIGFTRQAVAN